MAAHATHSLRSAYHHTLVESVHRFGSRQMVAKLDKLPWLSISGASGRIFPIRVRLAVCVGARCGWHRVTPRLRSPPRAACTDPDSPDCDCVGWSLKVPTKNFWESRRRERRFQFSSEQDRIFLFCLSFRTSMLVSRAKIPQSKMTRAWSFFWQAHATLQLYRIAVHVHHVIFTSAVLLTLHLWQYRAKLPRSETKREEKNYHKNNTLHCQKTRRTSNHFKHENYRWI